jgi:thiamine pyrophosphate-dependent acetolactate synthase large subunit-like protein
MMEPKFDFAARLADLIDEARDPVMAIGGPLSDEEIIATLEEAIEALREGLL